MSDRPADPAELEPDAPQGSVFGNLPDSRPGGRSPRRDAAAKPKRAAPKPRKATATAAKPRSKPRPKPASKPSSPPPQPPAEPEPGGGLEDIAWAGVATIAEAATVGIRLLNKSIEALRGGSEKS